MTYHCTYRMTFILPLLQASQEYLRDRLHPVSPVHGEETRKIHFSQCISQSGRLFVITEHKLTASPLGPGRPVIPLEP